MAQPLPNIHGGPVRLVIPGWPGSVSAKWFTRLWVRDKYHDGPGMGATSYRVAIKPMVPGDKPDDGNFRDLESMPVRSIITSPANGTKLAAGTKEVKLRGAAWAGDTPSSRSTSRSTSARPGRAPSSTSRRTSTTGSAGPRRVEAAVGRLLRNLDARHQLQGRDAAAYRRQLESAGLRRQSDAPGRGAGRLMLRALVALRRPASRWPPHCSASGGAFAQAPQFTPRDENPEDFPRRPRPRRHVLRLHRLPQLQARGAAGHDPPAVGRLAAMDDRPARHVAAAGQGAEDRARLSRSDLPAARAGAAAAAGRIRSRRAERAAPSIHRLRRWNSAEKVIDRG